jgi:UDP-N-acetylglucosamine 2-epimerase (non-hydrolysing)
MKIVVSTHPRTRRRLVEHGREFNSEFIWHEPFGFLDYNKLQLNAFCVVSDSGTISEESSIFGFPAVSLRDSIEKPEALETGSIILTGLSSENLIRSVELVRKVGRPSNLPDGYEILDFSNRVLKFLLSTANLHRNWSNLHRQS